MLLFAELWRKRTRKSGKEVDGLSLANIIELLSGVALFLFGMGLMGDGLKKVAGSKLELVLFRLSSTALRGILLGTGVTAVIQSSSATSVMVVGFVNSGMMRLRQAIGVVMGAILGTSITGWIICLSSIGGGSGWVSLISTSTLTGVIAVTGIILRMFCKKQVYNHLGDILLGFAVLMYGISGMSGAVSPLRESEAFVALMTRFSNPVLGLLVGVLITSVLQSASAAVGILQALAITGAIDFATALPIIMGMAIGAAVPVLLCAIGACTDARRVAFAYLVINVLGAVVVGVVFYALNGLMHFPLMGMTMSSVSIALVNTLFRLAAVLVLAPFIPMIEKQLHWLVPERDTAPEEFAPQLEERFLAHPALAIENCGNAIHAMAEVAQENILRAMELLDDFSPEGFAAVQQREMILDRYEDKLGSYLVRLTAEELSAPQTQELGKYLHAIGDLERIGDHALNIAETGREIASKKICFSTSASRELDVMSRAVRDILQLSIGAFMRDDLEAAYRVEPLEELIDNLCDEMKLRHVSRLQHGLCTLSNGFAFNDLITNYERVSDHCSNLALALIEQESERFDPHEYLDSVKEMKSGAFARYYDEYSSLYSL